MARPAKYKTPAELEQQILKYFDEVKKQDSVITLTGLVLYCEFCDKQSFYDYEKKEAFTCLIKRARTMVEKSYEERLKGNNVAGAIFALKNMGWHDRTEVTGADGKDLYPKPILPYVSSNNSNPQTIKTEEKN